jgi:hypothetical protein
MTRAEKIKKLGNAIKRLRGLKSLNTGKWQTPPDPSAVDDVLRWLQKLGHTEPLILKAELELILNFKTVGEYEAWISEL